MLVKGATDVLAMSVIFLVSGELGPRENSDQANPARWRTRPIFLENPAQVLEKPAHTAHTAQKHQAQKNRYL